MNMMTNQTTATTIPTTSTTPAATTAPTLASSAMLVEVNISNWAGRKKDKRASSDVTYQNHAHTGVASVNKKLLADSENLMAIQRHVTATRAMHANMTMPWSNSGLRLLPTAQYFKYHQAMTQMQDEFHTLVTAFLDSYNDDVINVQLKLGDLFSTDDYPTVDTLARKFAFRLNYMPLPDAGDFRVDIGNDALREVREQYEKFYADQYTTAMNDVWHRVHDALSRMSERLDFTGDSTKNNPDRKIFRDSLVHNVTDLIDLLRVCNVTGSTQMSAMADKLENAMQGITPDALREDEYLRAETKRTVDAAIAALPSLDI